MSARGLILRMCREGARDYFFSHQHANNVAINSANNKHFPQRGAEPITEPRAQLGPLFATVSFAVVKPEQYALEGAEYKPVGRSQLYSI